MIDLEGLAQRLANALYEDSDLDEAEKAKIEYGFSLTMGIGLTLLLTLVPAVFLGTVFITFVLMASALGTRLFSGGAHCTSYARCLFLSLLIFIPGGVFAKCLAENGSPRLIALISCCLAFSSVAYYLCKQARLALPIALMNAVALASGYLLKGRLLPEVMLPVAMGVFIQTIMTTRPGQWLVEKADCWLKRVIK
ncbi:MAG: accessory gene regulator B family protein [Eubacteriales bacterium]|nr:accessory gene regulator B family protein [Eubacteriales bacterium]MDD3074575.1 accessory gene regulator B family protein [Eubacteriales bacterium]MDD4769502.1 accessory gene regulator B family protein [Eubacteriales bacterium]